MRGSSITNLYCQSGTKLFRESGRDGVCGRTRWKSESIRFTPGAIDTPIWTKLPTSAWSNAPIDPSEVAGAGVPLDKAGQAQDIANGVLFLASGASNYMGGAELVIAGGMTAARDLAGTYTGLDNQLTRIVPFTFLRSAGGEVSV